MNVQHAPRASTESRERHSSARVPGRWLLLARVGWLTLVVLTLAIFFASLPVYIAQLQTPCAGAGCPFSSQQFTPEQVGALKGYDVAIVGSTLVSAALFGPLRQRIQQTIDRRFYRRKYDAVRILAAFSTTLRNEVDLNQLREQLVAVIEETMQPTFVSLWLRPPAHDGKRQASWRATPPASSDGR